MILAYALGGGLGHVTRVRALHATLGGATPLTILTSNPAAADPRVAGDTDVLVVPAELARDARGIEAHVRATTEALDPEQVLVDTFPMGILGELQPGTFGGRPLEHVARAVRWERYAELPGIDLAPGGLPRFARTSLVEGVGQGQSTFLAARSDIVTELALEDAPEPARDAGGAVVRDLRAAAGLADDPGAPPLWVVVHSGPEAETLELVAYAQEAAAAADAHRAQVVLITRRRPTGLDPGVVHLDVHPVWPLLGQADHIVTAGGWNALRQARRHPERVHALPFERRFDDQYARVRRFRADHGVGGGSRATMGR